MLSNEELVSKVDSLRETMDTGSACKKVGIHPSSYYAKRKKLGTSVT